MTFLSLAKFLSWEGDSGSARNSSIPRETFTAPATLPLFSTSGASRTSTTSVLPSAIISRACTGVTRDTAALAASIICLTLVAMSSSLMLKLKVKDRRPQDTAFGECLERVQSRRIDDVRDERPLPSKSGQHAPNSACCATRSEAARVNGLE